MIGRTISYHRIVSQLGGGGMGVVYEGEELKLRRPGAVKLLPEELAVILWVSPLIRVFAVR